MITDDGSNGSLLATLVAFLLIGGIVSTIRGMCTLRRIQHQVEADSLAGSVVHGPWGSSGANNPDKPWSLP